MWIVREIVEIVMGLVGYYLIGYGCALAFFAFTVVLLAALVMLGALLCVTLL
jgi:hypothetical protein